MADFWDTVGGHNLAGILQYTLPKLVENLEDLTKEVQGLREENRTLSQRIETLTERVEIGLAEEYGYQFEFEKEGDERE